MRKDRSLGNVIIARERLEAWIEAGWIAPGVATGKEPGLSEMDIARAQLICDLKDDLGVNDEGVEVILELLDQLYGLRCAMREMMESVVRRTEG
ncbi:MAG TPA: chaperone modulator CbpM [Aestuariivirgaceae bacterium]|jgi:chaperone modulatory protein CbpM